MYRGAHVEAGVEHHLMTWMQIWSLYSLSHLFGGTFLGFFSTFLRLPTTCIHAHTLLFSVMLVLEAAVSQQACSGLRGPAQHVL